MSTENRVEFTKLVLREVAAFLCVFAIAFAFSYSTLGLLYLFVSNGAYVGETYIISKAFDTFLFTFFTFIPFPIIYFWRLSYYKDKIRDWNSNHKTWSIPVLVLLGISLGLLLYGLYHLIEFTIVNFYGKEFLPTNFWLEYKSADIWERLLLFTLLAILLPVFETLFFIEMIFGNLLRGGLVKTAYIFTTLAYAISYDSLTFFFYIVFCGFIFACLYHKTKSIVPALFANIILGLCSYSFFFT